MLRIGLLFSLGLCAVAQPPGGQILMSGSGTLKSGVTIRFKTVATPAGIDWSSFGEGGISDDANAIHRVLVDTAHNLIFGYDLVIGRGDAQSGYLATFQTLSKAHLIGRAGDAYLSQAPDPRFPPPQVLHDGDVIPLDIMVSPDGKQKITDYLEFLTHEPQADQAAALAEPIDFTVDDGPITFQAGKFAVMIDGQRYAGVTAFTGKPGATFWIAFPGQGRYILSLVPHEGFSRNGAVRGSTVTFQGNGHDYEVCLTAPIAGAGKAWNLYVLHDPAYAAQTVKTGTDRLDNLLPRR